MGPTGRCIKIGDPLPEGYLDGKGSQDYSNNNPPVSLIWIL